MNLHHLLMNPPLAPKPGVYEHFKGGQYFAPENSLELDSDTLRWRVRYQSVDAGVWFSRLYSDFHALVLTQDGSSRVLRFRFISDSSQKTDIPIAS